MTLWFEHDGVVYNHLTASNASGYANGANFALYGAAIDHFAGAGVMNLGGGAGFETTRRTAWRRSSGASPTPRPSRCSAARCSTRRATPSSRPAAADGVLPGLPRLGLAAIAGQSVAEGGRVGARPRRRCDGLVGLADVGQADHHGRRNRVEQRKTQGGVHAGRIARQFASEQGAHGHEALPSHLKPVKPGSRFQLAGVQVVDQAIDERRRQGGAPERLAVGKHRESADLAFRLQRRRRLSHREAIPLQDRQAGRVLVGGMAHHPLHDVHPLSWQARQQRLDALAQSRGREAGFVEMRRGELGDQLDRRSGRARRSAARASQAKA